MSDLKWQDRGKKTAPYVWTAKDEAFEHGRETAGVSDPRVTPYRIKPGKLSGAGQYTAGQVVTVPLDMIPQIGEPWTINRFYPAGEFDWEKLEGDEAEKTKDCKTIGELCQKLFSINPRKYVELYYNFEKLDKEARHNVAAMLFEYWDNAQLRYDVTKQGFDWEVMSRDRLGAPSIPAVKGESRLLYVMVRKPSPEKRAVAPGAQTLVASPDIFKLLDLHVGELNQKVARAQALLDQSEQYMRARTKLAHQVTALRVLLQVSASAKREQAQKAVALVDHARSVEQKIDKPSREAKLSELFAMDKGPHAPSLVKVIRRELGIVDDIAAELKSCRDEICRMLFDDNTLFATHAEAFGVWVRDRKQEQAQPTQVMYSKLAFSLAAALDVLNEADMEERYHEKAEKVIKSTPEQPFTDPRKAGPCLFDKVMSFLGRCADTFVWKFAKAEVTTLANMWGNLAGPPSISIALIQSNRWNQFRTQVLTAGEGAQAEAAMNKFIDETLKYLDDHGTKMSDKTRDAFRDAMKRRDPNALEKIKQPLLDEFSGAYQSSRGAKLGGLMMQVVVMAMAFVEYYNKKDKTAFDHISFWVPAVGTFIGGADAVITLFRAAEKLPRLFAALQPLGMAVGLVTGLIGILSSFEIMNEAKKYNDTSGALIGLISATGNAFFVIACGAWFAKIPIPQVQAVGLGLMTVGGVAIVLHEELERQKTAVSKVAVSLVNEIQLNPFYSAFANAEGSGVSASLSAIEAASKEGYLHLAPNNTFVLQALEEAGFDRKTILAVVEPSGAPLSPVFSPAKDG